MAIIRRLLERLLCSIGILLTSQLKCSGVTPAPSEQPRNATGLQNGVDTHPHPGWQYLNNDSCGINVEDRIVGGTQASLGQFPWIALLGYSNYWGMGVEFRCGGALINKDYVITASHCVDDKVILVRLGEHNTDTVIDCEDDVCAPQVQDIKPSRIIDHPNQVKYVAGRSDIALIKLTRPASINDYVRPICIPKGQLLTKSYLGKTATVAGWGATKGHSPVQSKSLLYVRVPIIEARSCKKSFPSFRNVGQICAGGVIGSDSCGGDSGGPLMKKEAIDGRPPRQFLLGVVSYGRTDCGSQHPAVYTDIRYYIGWILDNIVS